MGEDQTATIRRLRPATQTVTALPSTSPLTRHELNTAFTLASALFLRMLALFMLTPVLALYVDTLAGATPLLIGLAIGIYGLTQAALQIPLGMLSDRVGRLPVIGGGLIVFIVGSIIAAFAGHIWPLIVGRAVQGVGAVSGATLALAADLTRDSQRTKVMAIIGISVGAAFSIALVVGPALNAALGLRGLFLVAALLGAAAIAVLILGIPRATLASTRVARHSGGLRAALVAPELRILYLGVFTVHGVLSASFVAIPMALTSGMRIPAAGHATVYLPILALSLLLVIPLMRGAERPGRAHRRYFGSILGIALAECVLALAWHQRYAGCAALVLFFAAINYLEASLPSTISRVAPVAGKGTALGAYATFQFLGVFAGGVGGGLVADGIGFRAVPLACAVACLVWFALSARSLTEVLDSPVKD